MKTFVRTMRHAIDREPDAEGWIIIIIIIGGGVAMFTCQRGSTP